MLLRLYKQDIPALGKSEPMNCGARQWSYPHYDYRSNKLAPSERKSGNTRKIFEAENKVI